MQSRNVMKVFFVILLFISNAINVLSQKSEMLILQLEKANTPAEKAQLYNKLSDSRLTTSPKLAKLYADSALFLASKNTLYKEISNAYVNHANIKYMHGELDSSLFYLNKSHENILKSKNHYEIASSLNRLGLLFEAKSNYRRASEYFMSALNLYDSIRSKEGQADVYNNLGIVNDKFLFTDNALLYYKKAYKLYTETQNKTGEAFALNNIASVYMSNNQPDTALKYLTEIIPILKEDNNLPGLATVYNNIAEICNEKNKQDSALYYLEKSLAINRELSRASGLSTNYLIFAKIYAKSNELDKAIHFLQKGLNISEETENLTAQLSIIKEMSETYKKLKDYKKALVLLEKYNTLEDSIKKESAQHTISELQIKYETAKKDAEIQLLSKEADFNRKFTIMLIIIVIALVAVSLLLFYATRAKTKLLRKNKKLHEQKERLIKLELQNKRTRNKMLQDEINKQHQINKLQEDRHRLKLEHKNRELAASTIHLLNKNKTLASIRKSLEEIQNGNTQNVKSKARKISRTISQNMNLDEDWKQFKLHFESVNTGFFDRLQERYPNITKNDLRLCAYIRINLSAKEIAQMLNITPAAVNKRMYRLKKKIKLKQAESLSELILKI